MTSEELVDVILAHDGGTCHGFGHMHCFNDPTAKWEGRRCDDCKTWAGVVARSVVPPITNAIYHAITDVAFEVFVDTDGERSIKVHLHHEGMTEAAKIALEWEPGPRPPMRVKERIYDDE